MAVGIDEYKVLKSEEKIELFTELFSLKAEKSSIEKRIKELEANYKDDVAKAGKDLYFELPLSHIKFSIKKSIRKGSVDTKAMVADGVDVDSYRKPDSEIFTLRLDK